MNALVRSATKELEWNSSPQGGVVDLPPRLAAATLRVLRYLGYDEVFVLRAPFHGPAEVVAFDCRWHPSRATGRLKITPWFEGMRPVISVLRFGIHTGFDTHAFSKTGATLGERIEVWRAHHVVAHEAAGSV